MGPVPLGAGFGALGGALGFFGGRPGPFRLGGFSGAAGVGRMEESGGGGCLGGAARAALVADLLSTFENAEFVPPADPIPCVVGIVEEVGRGTGVNLGGLPTGLLAFGDTCFALGETGLVL